MEPLPLECGRVAAFIDGLNVYHALVELPELRGFRWLNYWSLGERILQEMDVTTGTRLVAVKWCTAYFHPEGTDGRDRHQTYRAALEVCRVETILDHFKRNPKTVRCEICGKEFRRTIPEEKQTDVNIAACCVAGASTDEFDTALLVTGDTDLLPLFRIFKQRCPKKRILVACPPGKKRSPKAIRTVALRSRKIKPEWLRACQLPDPVVGPDGVRISCPQKWKASP